MRFELANSGRALRFAHLDPQLAQLICMAPDAARAGASHPASRQRLFPDPSGDKSFNAEWQEIVQPSLAKLFLSASEQVTADLTQSQAHQPDEDGMCSIEIPLEHVDAWLNCLNAARLSLAEQFDFTDNELAETGPSHVDSPRSLALLQIHFYAILQECLISQICDQ